MIYNADAERAVLGSILLENSCLEENILDVSDFYLESNRRIFAVMVEKFGKGEAIDPVTMSQPETRLLQEGKIPLYYLSELTDHVPSAAGFGHYSKIVKERSILRRLYELGEDITKRAPEEDDSFGLLDDTERTLNNISQAGVEDGFTELAKNLPEQTAEVIRASEQSRPTGLLTGFRLVDALSGGLHPGEVIVIAARPGLGKTTFALNLAGRVAKRKTPVAILSLEMTEASLKTRMICSEISVDSSKVRAGQLSRIEREEYQRGAGFVSNWPVYINDNASTTMMRLKMQARRLVSKFGVKLLIIDYLQLMRSGEKGQSRYDENTNNSRDLHNLAGQLKIPIILLSQLNRVSEKENREPRLSDLRESGAIEQDADMVWMLHAQEDWDRVKLIFKKNRGGATGAVWMDFEKIFNRFTESLRQDENEQQQ